MAPTATFAADFSAILKEIVRVENAMDKLELAPRGVERAFDRMQRSYSGAEIVQQAEITARAIESIGGVSKLTARELEQAGTVAKQAAEKMRALGMDVPQHIQKLASAIDPIPEKLTLMGKAATFAKSSFGQMFGAFSAANLVDRAVSSILSFGSAAFESAGMVADLADKTGLTAVAIQQMDHVAKQTGATLENFTDASFKLGVNLSGGSTSVVKGVEEIGLKFQDLQRMRPDQQFEKVVGALGKMQDATERNRIGVELFGRNFSTIAASVASGYEQIAKQADVSSDEQIKALDRAGDAWERFKKKASTALTTVLGEAALAFEKIQRFLQETTFPGSTKGNDISSLLDPLLAPQGAGSGGGAQVITSYTIRLQELQKELLTTDERMRELAFGGGKQLAELPNAIASNFAKAEDELQSWSTFVEKQPLDLKKWENALYALPPAIKSMGVEIEKVVAKGGKLSSFFSGITGGLKDLWQGMSGGGGIGGLFGKIGTGISEGFGNLISGGLTSVINTGISLLGKGISKLFGSMFGNKEHEKVNDMRDAFEDAAGGFEALSIKAAKAGVSLDRFFSAKKVKDYEAAVADLQMRFDEFDADQARLQSAIEKYGFSLEELGPQLQKSRLDEQAKELIEDWRVLAAAGIDVSTVNEKMATAMNDYLQTALKIGMEVPQAMRPILESMAKQGKLVDANGNAIEDLEDAGIHFSETMTEGFDRVVKKLDELITKLGMAGDAMGNLNVPETPGWMSNTPYGEPVQIESAAAAQPTLTFPGAFVTREESGGNVVTAIRSLVATMARQQALLPLMVRDQMYLAMAAR